MQPDEVQRLYLLSVIRAQNTKDAYFWSDEEARAAYAVAVNPKGGIVEFAATLGITVEDAAAPVTATGLTQAEMDAHNEKVIVAIKKGGTPFTVTEAPANG